VKADQRLPELIGKDQTAITPCRARCQPLKLVALSMLQERLFCQCRQRHFAAAVLCFRVGEDESPQAPAYGTAHLHVARVEVHVTPAEREQYSLAHAAGNRQHVERFETITPHRLKEGARLLWREDFHGAAELAGRRGQDRHVALHQADAESIIERLVKRYMHVANRSRRKALSQLLSVQVVELLRSKLRKRMRPS
jgi:hypothetical protein